MTNQDSKRLFSKDVEANIRLLQSSLKNGSYTSQYLDYLEVKDEFMRGDINGQMFEDFLDAHTNPFSL